MGGLTISDPNYYKWDDRYIQFTDHAKIECALFKIGVHEIIDMLHNQIKCPKTKKHNKSDKEICSKKNKKIFRIILFKDYCIDVGEICWCVRHVKPK